MDSQVKQGYKQTEVGVISEDWKIKIIGDVSTLQRGYDLPSRKRKEGNIPIITSSGSTDKHSEFKVLAPGVVTGRYGTIGELFYIKENFWPLNTTLYVKDFHGNHRLFIYYLLQTIDFSSHSGKSGVPGINRNDIHELKIGIPPIAEQEKIAEALSDVDSLIESLEELITKKRHIKQGAMQELLTGKRRLINNGQLKVNNNYKQTELGLIPEDWNYIKIENWIDILTGFPFSSNSYSNSGIRLLRGSNIKRKSIDWTEDITMYWSNVDFKLQKYILKENDIVIAMDGSLVGKSFAYLSKEDVPSLLVQRVARIRSNVINQEFLKFWILNSRFTDHCDSVKTVAAIPHISPSDIKSFSIVVPPTKAEQEAIAEVLTDMDNEITALEEKLQKTRHLKQGMMQELLTGKTRLI